MPHPRKRSESGAASLARRLREARHARGLTLRQVAKTVGVSASFISQVESGAANPSIGSLQRICAAIGIPLGTFFDGAGHTAETPMRGLAGARAGEVRVVRKGSRKMLAWPGSTARLYLLTPDLQRKLEVILSVAGPGETSGNNCYAHYGEEFGVVLQGRYEVTVGRKTHVLEEGDSIYFPSHVPHRTRVLGDAPATTLWVMTPPSF